LTALAPRLDRGGGGGKLRLVAFERAKLQKAMAGLTAKGVYVGTSSWKYPGWRGMIYDENKYITCGKFSESRFEPDCLTEYDEVEKRLENLWNSCKIIKGPKVYRTSLFHNER
jgi:hypothetical protein